MRVLATGPGRCDGQIGGWSPRQSGSASEYFVLACGAEECDSLDLGYFFLGFRSLPITVVDGSFVVFAVTFDLSASLI